MEGNQNTQRKTIYKVHPNTEKRKKREALIKRLSDGKKAAQEARNNPQPMAVSLDESEQGIASSSSSDSDDVDLMDVSGITTFSTPSKEELDSAKSPEKGKYYKH